MAAKRVGIMDIRQLLQLKIKGQSNRRVEEIIGIHRNSVNTYVRLFKASGKSFGDLLALSDKDLLELFPSSGTIDKQRYEDLSSDFDYFRKELKKPGCTRQKLWEEYLLKCPEGYGYTQFNEHLNRWLHRVKGSGKLEHKAGDKLLVDYTGQKPSYVNKETGELIEVEVMVAILPCSQYTFVEASPSQKLEDFIGSMNSCLDYLGGVPQVIVPDNLKSAVTKGSKYAPILNKTFKDFALHYNCAINPTRTHSPQDKAMVEGAVKIVYQRIFYPLSKMTFFSLEDMNKEIRKLRIAYNDYLLSHLKVSRLQQFQTIEQSFLAPLPKDNYEIKTYKKATVQKMGYVFVSSDRHYYSVPFRYIGKKVEVSFDRQTVEIHYNRERIATHKRDYRSGKYSTIKDHLSSSHNFYRNWSPEYFQQLARPHGSQVEAYIKDLIEQAAYPEVAYKQCLGIIALAKTYGNHRLNKACKRGFSFHQLGYHIIKKILENKMDQVAESTEEQQSNIPEHQNIRGSQYFLDLLNQLN